MFQLIIAISWSLFVSGFYYLKHSYYSESLSFFLNETIAIAVFLGLLVLGASFIRKTFRISIFRVFLIFVLINVVVFNLIMFFKDLSIFKSGFSDGVMISENGEYSMYETSKVPDPSRIAFKEGELISQTGLRTIGFPAQAKEMFKQNSFFATQYSFLINFFPPIIFVSFLTFLFFIIGQTLLRKFFKDPLMPIYEEFLISIGIGFMLLSFLMFLLGAASVLNLYFVIPLIGILSLLSFRSMPKFYKIVFQEKTDIKIRSFFSILLCLVLVFASFNVINLLRPIPVSWDEISEYLNLPNLIANYGKLIPRPAYYYSIINSLGFIIAKSATWTMFISFIFGIFAISSLYIFLKKNISPTLSLLLTASFYSLPFIYWQSGVDIKTDIPLLFIGILSLLSLLLWHEKKENKYLWLCAIFAGFAFGIKYTALIFILTLIPLVALFLLNKRISILIASLELLSLYLIGYVNIIIPANFSSYIRILAFFFLVIGFSLLIYSIVKKWPTSSVNVKLLIVFALLIPAPFSPWLIKNLVYKPEFSVKNIFYSDYDIRIPYNDLGIKKELCSSIEGNEDMTKYTGGGIDIEKMFFLPWDLTMNTYLKMQHVDISFIFLAFIPALLLFFKKKKYIFLITFVFTFLYFLFFTITSFGIIWYGILGFPGFLLILGLLLREETEKKSIISYLILSLFGVWFLTVLPVRYTWATNNEILAYISSYINEQSFLERIFPGTLDIQNVLKEGLRNNDKKIIRIGTFSKFWIPQNDVRVVDDDGMNVINCFYFEKNYVKTLERLQKFGIKYIILDKQTDTVELDKNGPVHKRFQVTQDFVSKLKLVYENERFWMYEVES